MQNQTDKPNVLLICVDNWPGHLLGGAGSTDFLGDNFFTVTLGAGVRMLVNDSLSWRLDVRDHIFDRDTFGENETTNNIELSTGVTYFF